MDNVICNGKFIIKDKELLTIDKEQVFKNAQQMSDGLVKKLKIEGFKTPIDSQWGQYKAYYPHKRFRYDELDED